MNSEIIIAEFRPPVERIPDTTMGSEKIPATTSGDYIQTC